mmetsp:Transcript_8390/g.18385  ORF Transcript_8390/g.18385 Transcript_8390/m.18385 type:complete len:1171 (-) Transcript_8390:1742-5254(-)
MNVPAPSSAPVVAGVGSLNTSGPRSFSMSSTNFGYSHLRLKRIAKLQFGITDPAELIRYSVTQAITVNGRRVPAGITRFETTLAGQPVYGGVNDPRMGSLQDKADPGFFGHIELSTPVYHQGFINIVLKTLRCVCYHCSEIKCDRTKTYKYVQAVKGMGRRSRKSRLEDLHHLLRGRKKCDHCGGGQPRYTKSGLHIEADYADVDGYGAAGSADRKAMLPASKAHEIFSRMSNEDMKALGLDVSWARPEWMMVTVLPVPPLHVRPSVSMGAGQCEDDLTYQYVNVVKSNIALKQAMANGEPNIILTQFEQSLQHNVTATMDNEVRGMPQVTQRRSGRALKTVQQRLKGKEGRIRGNLMGKRVDFSARTVITADPNLGIEHVGVPRSVASNLTVPERVTPFNISILRELVANGPLSHPGAKHIIRTDGTRVDLRYVKNKNELCLEYGWIVERHLRDDDVIVFNRQPSLHKMSIMGHRVRVLDFSTFRLNLSCTSPYNADFDGDEMNLHVPQSLAARSEVELMMLSPRVIVSGQSNRPVMGIVQDSLLAVQKMTQRGIFIEKDLIMNLLMWVKDWDGRVPVPCILKPRQLWSGKQIVSMILPKINLSAKGNDGPGVDENDKPKTNDLNNADHIVQILDGELIQGTIDKKAIGSGMGGIIHTSWLDRGFEDTALFMSQIQVVINYWVLQHSFSIGVTDTVADIDTMLKIETTINDAKVAVHELVRKGQSGDLEAQPGRTMIDTFETCVNRVLNTARDQSGKSAQLSLDMTNSVKAMVTSGSKGSFINISQIMACVGQQNVEGKRIPCGFKKRTLPHFNKDDLGPESRGFVENSYLRGLSPQEFFFHAMGGREGLIDTACKTAETGYIQRRLVKAMETVMARYDGTLRTSNGSIVQFLYGEDGMDAVWVERQTFDSLTLKRHEFHERYLLNVHEASFGIDNRGMPYLTPKVIEDCRYNQEIQELLDKEISDLEEDRRILRIVMANREPGREAEEDSYAPGNIKRVLLRAKRQFPVDLSTPSDLHPSDIISQVNSLLGRLIVVRGEDKLSAEAQINATTLYRILIRSQLAVKRVCCQHRLSARALKWVVGEIESRFNLAKVNPGEMAGVLAAQSIGEPATQMTLNVSILHIMVHYCSNYRINDPTSTSSDLSLRWSVRQKCHPRSTPSQRNYQRR